MSGRETRRVRPEEAGTRLDRLVTDLPGIGSRARARRAVERGKILLDGRPCGPEDAGRPVRAGAIITYDPGRPGTARAPVRATRDLERAGIRILHADDALVAVDKPAGLLTEATRQQRAQDRDSARRRLEVWSRTHGGALEVVHRLDRDTSGVVLMARTEAAALDLHRQFRTHRAERVYLAVVQGVPEGEDGRWEDWMAWDARERVQRACRPEARGGVLAAAEWRCLERYAGDLSLLEIRLVTGRRNQIRLHCMLRAHPLVGEKQYLPEDWTPRPPAFPRQALHAQRLRVLHPEKRRPISFEAPLPEDLAGLLARLRKRR